MVKPFIAHYRNKYPGGYVDSDGSSYLRAYDGKGNLRVVLCSAAGSLQDRSKICGAPDSHDASPIPKDCRVYCDKQDGVELHKDSEARAEVAKKVSARFGGRVPSIEEMSGKSFQQSHEYCDKFRAAEWLEKNPEAKVSKK